MESQHNIGVMLSSGLGVKKNEDKAVEWFRRAARQGERLAEEALQRRGVSRRGLASTAHTDDKHKHQRRSKNLLATDGRAKGSFVAGGDDKSSVNALRKKYSKRDLRRTSIKPGGGEPNARGSAPRRRCRRTAGWR